MVGPPQIVNMLRISRILELLAWNVWTKYYKVRHQTNITEHNKVTKKGKKKSVVRCSAVIMKNNEIYETDWLFNHKLPLNFVPLRSVSVNIDPKSKVKACNFSEFFWEKQWRYKTKCGNGWYFSMNHNHTSNEEGSSTHRVASHKNLNSIKWPDQDIYS